MLAICFIRSLPRGSRLIARNATWGRFHRGNATAGLGVILGRCSPKETIMAHPATKKRGGNPNVKHTPDRDKPDDAMERKLEQGLEESMAGSDPASVTQPSKSKADKQQMEKER